MQDWENERYNWPIKPKHNDEYYQDFLNRQIHICIANI